MLNKIKSRASAVIIMAFAMVTMALPAFAQTTVTGEITDAFSELQTTVLGVIAALFALAVIGVGIRVGLKYVRRGASAA
jgi:type IV secretory pathway VirB2 component (pilin)